MTTASWSTRVRSDDNATYQEWRDEFITKLGIMVTASKLAADETNITPGAGAKPATNTEQGYAVYHISDSLHGTAPIYMRFGFGTGSNANAPRIQVTIGTATNGSGVISGIGGTIADIGTFNAAQTTDVARQSYLCVIAGFFGINWKSGSTCDSCFFVCRTVDSDGVMTATGALANWSITSQTSANKRQAFRYAATAVAYTATTQATSQALGINPQAPTNTTVGSDIQVALGWTITPRASPLLHVCGVNKSELAIGGTFNATLVGTTAHTYLTISDFAGPFGPVGANATGGLTVAMIWE